jgi:trimeric autotransporter adhesin
MKINTPTILIALVLACSGLCLQTRAVNPPPDGGYANFNTAEGQNALLQLTTGVANTANGWFSLAGNTDGSFNTGVGAGTLVLNVGNQSTEDGIDNTAVGAVALFLNTSGSDNTAVGTATLLNNDGDNNTAVGAFALNQNTTGAGHTAVGFGALRNSTAGAFNTVPGETVPTGFGGNTAIGANALFTDTSGNGNTAVGAIALFDNDTGFVNTAIGAAAGALITGDFNICIGAGVSGVAGENNTIRIGDNLSDTQGDSACYIGGIFNQLIDPASDTIVGIDANGKLGTAVPSSRRFKQDIKPMDKASEAILALKPVAFRYKGDAKNTPCFGLIAEEVAEVNPDLVVRNKNGEIYTVRYEQINAMLLNEFLKEHKLFLEEQSKVRNLEAALETVNERLKEQEEKIGKVSAQLEINKQVPTVVQNNQ